MPGSSPAGRQANHRSAHTQLLRLSHRGQRAPYGAQPESGGRLRGGPTQRDVEILWRYVVLDLGCDRPEDRPHQRLGDPFARTPVTACVVSAALWDQLERADRAVHEPIGTKLLGAIPEMWVVVRRIEIEHHATPLPELVTAPHEVV